MGPASPNVRPIWPSKLLGRAGGAVSGLRAVRHVLASFRLALYDWLVRLLSLTGCREPPILAISSPVSRSPGSVRVGKAGQ